MWIDATDFFAAVEQEPRTLTREDMVVLALADDRRTPGFCCACGASLQHKGQNSRWCDGCQYVHARFRENARYRSRTTLGECERCGGGYTKQAGNQKYCAECREVVVREQSREGMRRRKGFRQDRVCLDCGADITLRPGAKRCLECAKEHTLRYNREYMRGYHSRYKGREAVA
jgi:hypothetical protein